MARQGRKLTAEQQARKDAILKARNSQSKAETRAAAREDRKISAVQEAVQKRELQKQADEEFLGRLETGKLKQPADWNATAQPVESTGISSNLTYHHALYNAIADIRGRVDAIKNDAITNKEKQLQLKVDAKNAATPDTQKVTLDNYTDDRGRRTQAGIPTSLQKKIDGPSWALNQAKSKLDLSEQAHRAGDHISAMDLFSQAGDHVIAALNATKENFSTQKYSKVFNSPDYAADNNEMAAGGNSNRQISNVVNGYTKHVLENGVSSGALHPEIAAAVVPEVTRNYTKLTRAGESNTAATIPGWYKTKSREDIKKEQAEKSARSQARLAASDKERAIRGGRNITRADDSGLSDFEEAVESAPRTGNPVPFDIRWRREEIQPVFERDEAINESSAKNAGIKDYVPKTFIGSEAHTDPEKWNQQFQVKQHWLRTNKGAKPHEFEGTEGHIDPEGYATKHKLEFREIPKPYSKWARQTGMTGFNPTRNEERTANIAEVESGLPSVARIGRGQPHPGLDVPENINWNQQARARRAGIPLTKEETRSSMANSTVTMPHPTDPNKTVKKKFSELTPEEQNNHLSTVGSFNVSGAPEEATDPSNALVEHHEYNEEPVLTSQERVNTFIDQAMGRRNSAFNSGRGL
jgi:hypothetical protein